MSIKIYTPNYDPDSGVGMEEITLQHAYEIVKRGKYWACVEYEDHLSALAAQHKEDMEFAEWWSTLERWMSLEEGYQYWLDKVKGKAK